MFPFGYIIETNRISIYIIACILYIMKAYQRRIPSLIATLIGAVIVTFILYIALGLTIYAIPFILIILGVVSCTAVWRWRQGDSVVPDAIIKVPIETRTDDLHKFVTDKAKCLGTVYGEAIVANHMVKDFWSSTKVIFGGEPAGYQKMMSLSRKVATNRMKRSAIKKGANIITGHRLATTSILNTSAEVISYGTAWKTHYNIPDRGKLDL